MRNKPVRVVLDTNIFIYFLISKSHQNFDRLLKNSAITLVFSEELLVEFMEVVARPKFKKYFNKKDVDLLINHLHNHAEIVIVKSKVSVCRDKSDNFLLALSKDGKADYLITGDEDLLIIKKFKKTKILKMNEFLKLF